MDLKSALHCQIDQKLNRATPSIKERLRMRFISWIAAYMYRLVLHKVHRKENAMRRKNANNVKDEYSQTFSSIFSLYTATPGPPPSARNVASRRRRSAAVR